MKKNKYDKRKRIIDLLLKYEIPVFSKLVHKRVYDIDFFIDANQLKIQSSAVIADILCELIDFKTVFDIGCGMGLYITELGKRGKMCVGCDASPDGVLLASPDVIVFLSDATKILLLNKKYDIVICFEVAEHIPKRHSRKLVSNCTSNGRRVLFTAAPPGQGGVGHINEQPYAFWINIFEDYGYNYNMKLSNKLREAMLSKNVVSWIANNIMVFDEGNA